MAAIGWTAALGLTLVEGSVPGAALWWRPLRLATLAPTASPVASSELTRLRAPARILNRQQLRE